MKWVGTIVREIFGLFVDDGSFAVAVVAWLVLAGLGLPRLAIVNGWGGPILFAGLVLILVESATRRARAGRDG